MTSIKEQLAAPFPPKEILWRIGQETKDGTKAMCLAYLDARMVMDRLDSVVGNEGWSDSYSELKTGLCCRLCVDYETKPKVCKSDGAGETNIEGEKGNYSDAFKRAAVKHGIGRYLYRMDTPWVSIEKKGKYSKITAAGMTQLQSILPKPKPSTVAEVKKKATTNSAPAKDEFINPELKETIDYYVFLRKCKAEKERIGEHLYKRSLDRFQLSKANSIGKRDEKKMREVLKDLSALPAITSEEGFDIEVSRLTLEHESLPIMEWVKGFPSENNMDRASTLFTIQKNIEEATDPLPASV